MTRALEGLAWVCLECSCLGWRKKRHGVRSEIAKVLTLKDLGSWKTWLYFQYHPKWGEVTGHLSGCWEEEMGGV